MTDMKVAAPTRAEFKPLTKVANLQELFGHPEFAKRINSAAPKHLSPERLLRTFVTAVQKTPKLMQVSPVSMMGACITLAALGLEPNTPLQHAHLIPFEVNKWNPQTRKREYIRTDVSVIIGYPGYLDLIYRSDKTTSVHCDVVWPGDEFSYEHGSNKHLRHKPMNLPRESGAEITHAYMYAKLANGDEEFTVMTLADIHRNRARSQGFQAAMYARDDALKNNKDPLRDKRYSEAPWIKDFEAMAKKTALRDGQKWLPKTIELAAAMTVEGHAEAGSIDFTKIASSSQVLEGGYEIVEDDEPEQSVPPTPEEKQQEPPPAKETQNHEKSLNDHQSASLTSQTTYPLFNQFGEEDDGPSGPATDPVTFAEKFSAIYAGTAPEDRSALEEFNDASLEAARAASIEASAVLGAIWGQESPSVESKPAYKIITKKTAAGATDMRDFIAQVRKSVAGLSTKADLEAFHADNHETADALSAAARTAYNKALDDRMAALQSATKEPEKAGDQAPADDKWASWANQLEADFAAAKSLSELKAIPGNAAVKSSLNRLREERPDLAGNLDIAYRSREKELQG